MKRRDAICLLVISLLVGPFGSLGRLQPLGEAAAPDAEVPPTLVERSPERGEELGLDQPIVMVFDRAMDARSVEAAFTIAPAVGGASDWPDERTLRFKPDAPLARDAAYTVQVGTGAAARDGATLAEPLRLEFRTVGFLLVTQVLPAPDSADVEVDSTVTIMFNRPVVPLTSLGQQAELPQPLMLDPPVEGAGEWLNTSVYTFKPVRPLAGAMTYRATVAAGLTDTTGGLLDGPQGYTWSFTTQLPQIVSIFPEEDATLVEAKPDIRIVFSQEVDCASARAALTLRKGRSSESIPGVVTCSGATLSFRPDELLDFNTRYEVRLTPGVASQGGGAGMVEGRTWRFTTVPLPRILSTDPTNGERSANPFTQFTIKFNTRVDPDSIMPHVQFTPPITAGRVYTYYRDWDQSLAIQFGAQPSSDYQVVIEPGIRDPYGNTIEQRKVVTFRTRALPPSVQIMVPGIVSTLSSYDPATIVVGSVNVRRVDLRLYRLDFAQMSKALDDWREYRPSLKALVRKWSQPIEAPPNETTAVPVALVEDGGALESGIYLLIGSAPGVDERPWAQRHLVVVSPINLTMKASSTQALVWATDAKSGRPVSGLSLSVLSADGSAESTATTTTDGLAQFDRKNASHKIMLVGSREPFALVSSQWSEGIGGSDFGFDRGYGLNTVRMHLYTDRPIYRAGQTVYFRGLVRLEHDVVFTLPTDKAVQVRIRNADGEDVLDKTMQLDDFGAFSGELTLAAAAPLGDYALSASYLGETGSARFQVAAYRAPEFEVNVQPQAAELAAAEPTSATVKVDYFFGGAVADVPLEWTVLTQHYTHSSEQFGRYSFADVDDPWACFDCWWRPAPPPTPLLSGSGRTDEQGRYVVDLPGNVAQVGVSSDGETAVGSRLLTVEATVQSRDGSRLSGRSQIVVHQGEFYVGLAPQATVGRAGKEMAVDVLTVDWEDERLPGQALRFQVYRREWLNTFVEDQNGSGQWKWETRDTLVKEGQLTTSPQGEGLVAFTPEKGGSYKIVVNGRDEAERLVQSSVFVWVSSPESVSWRRENNDRIDLIADRARYNVGDTAAILIPSPFEGEQWALMTVERGEIISHEVLQLESNSTVYRLPLTEKYLPNVYVSAVIVKGKDLSNPEAAYKVGYTALSIDPKPARLNLELASSASADKAAPGDTLRFDVRATDDGGEPVQAALSLDLVDKAVLSLSPRTPEAAFDDFYGHRPLAVETASGLSISLRRVVLEQLEPVLSEERQRFGMAADGMELAAAPADMMPVPSAPMMKGEAPAPPAGVALRSDFQDTAYWNAKVTTGEDGRAEVSIKLPDNLTTWVFRGVGITAHTLVGEATSDLLVTKPLLVRPVTPRFFVVGDAMQLAALVNNNTDAARDVAVTLGSAGLKLGDPAERTVRVDAGAEARITWNVVVSDVAAVDVIFSAVSGEYSDAARPRLTTGPDGTLLVRRYTAPDIVGTGGQLTAAGSRTEVVALPPNYDNREGELDVRLDPSLAAGMQDGLKYLEHYPYECTEQTVSRFLPNVLTYRALKSLGASNPELEAKLPGLVKQGLDKLLLQQHEDGGWGWWYDGESNPYVTSYVVFALNKAESAGFDVDGEMWSRGLDFLQTRLAAAESLNTYRDANLQAYILYVLTDSKSSAGAFDAQLDGLYEHREKLSHYARAYLAMALGKSRPKDDRIGTLLSDLQNAAILSATGAHWEEKDYDWWAMNTDTRSTAVILDALVQLNPDNALNPNVVRWLMVARKEGIWETTQETAWALIALTDWMVQTGELKGEYDYRVTLNGRELGAGAVDSGTLRHSVSLSVQVADLLANEGNRLTISRDEGPGRLYYTAHLKVNLPVEAIKPANRGIAVFREYVQPGCADNERCPTVKDAQVGDTVRVRLTIVAPHDLYYVMVEDPLPAGAEGVDVNLETTSMLSQRPGLQRLPEEGQKRGRFGWWWSWYSRTEMRDDRVALFADYLPAGTYEYTYTFQARLPGEYRVIPTTASEMYFPEVFGRSDGRLFTIREGGE